MQQNPILNLQLLILTIFLTASVGHAQTPGRFQDSFQSKSFVRNQGQFDHRIPRASEIQYGYEGNGQRIYFTSNKVLFNLFKAEKRKLSPAEKEQRDQRKKQGFSSPEEHAEFEKSGKRMKVSSDLLIAEWLGANPSPQLIPQEKDEFTHAYEYVENGETRARTGIPSYKKITYSNLYPNIDVEYVLHPESGVKYSLILHPGADLSQVKLRYDHPVFLQPDGSLTTSTDLGTVVDHPPVTFYEVGGGQIASRYLVSGNEISFAIDPYDATQTVVIDPWTDLPNDPGSNWNCAWECETDGLGNTYAIFGAMPLQLRKYNAAGLIQWTYNTTYDSTAWLGTFVTDDAGNSYVTNGSVAALRRVSTAGGLVWSRGNITGMLLGEFWNIAFNCDQTKLIVGGTGGGLIPEPYIFDVDMANGNLLGSVQVHQDKGLFDPQEVRGITATENGKYYWLTHDSLGFISENFANCPVPSSELVVNNNYNLGYKCENWRYNNTGIEALAYYNGFVYVNRGDRIDKRAFATGAITASAAIPGGVFNTGFGGANVENSGIVIDNTGRIFVGARGSVSQFDVNLNLVNTYAVTSGYNVYDVDLTSTGQLIACGGTGNSGSNSRTGYVESLGVLGVGPVSMACCDASICQMGDLCTNSGQVTLSPAVLGGTWTSAASGFNPVTGVFDPAIAGVGTYTFFYTLPCGTDSLVLDVEICPTLDVCVQGNGDLLVTNGVAPFSWDEGTGVTNCPFGPGAGCNFLTHAVQAISWTNFGTGVSVTPPPGADTIRVFDATLGDTIWEIAALPPCGVLPVELLYFTGQSIKPQTNSLFWRTSREPFLDHFTLERSKDGSHWTVVGTVEGKGKKETGFEYAFTDRNAFLPTTYYRIGETDLEGRYRHLSTIEVHSEPERNLVFNIHPNPAKGWVRFTYTGAGGTGDRGPLRVRFVNSLGEMVREASFFDAKANTVLDLDISGLAAGVYQLSFFQGGRSVSRKLVVAGR